MKAVSHNEFRLYSCFGRVTLLFNAVALFSIVEIACSKVVGQTVHVIAFGDPITHFPRNFASKIFDCPDHINSDTPELIVR